MKSKVLKKIFNVTLVTALVTGMAVPTGFVYADSEDGSLNVSKINNEYTVDMLADVVEAGTYKVPVKVFKEGTTSLSMADQAILKDAEIVVNENGNLTFTVYFKTLTVGVLQGKIIKVSFNGAEIPMGQGFDAEYNQGYTFTTNVDTSATEFNIPASVEIDVMNEMMGGASPQGVTMAFDWEKRVKETTPAPEPTPETTPTPEPTPEITPEPTPEITPEPTPAPEPTPEITPTPETDASSGSGVQSTLDIKNLENGVYGIQGKMLKTNKSDVSMADNAINHMVRLTVQDGKYSLTVRFKGMKIGNQLGYLGGIRYFKTGYTTDGTGTPQGELGEVTVDTYQLNADGTKVSDQYGTDYMEQVTFEMIPEAVNNGQVPLQVFVPVMEAIAAGNGTQNVYLTLDLKTLEKTEETDKRFEEDGEIVTTDKNGTLNPPVAPSNAGPSVKGGAPSPKVSPKTADESATGMFATLLGTASVVIYLLFEKKKKVHITE